MPLGRATERTYYPALLDAIRERGGGGASEANFNSEPDIIFDFLNRQWLLGVKIDETPAILKSAFVQYQRHKEESQRQCGILIFLPNTARTIPPTSSDLAQAVSQLELTGIIDTPGYKAEYRRLTFPQLLRRLHDEVGPKLAVQAQQGYSLPLVISLLQQQVNEMMRTISLTNPQLMQVITDRDLLSDISAKHLNSSQQDEASRFLASYIILSQILFLRILSTARPDIIAPRIRPVTHHALRQAFRQVLRINYRPIFEMDVLDAISESYLRDTFDLIWGLEVEQSRYELPGRIFHELMPHTIRKLLAAFYTRPQAAEMLAQLTIQQSGETVIDPACGSGTILSAVYRRKLELFLQEHRAGNPHKRFVEEEIFGADIMPFAVHLSSANLATMDAQETISHTQVMQADSLKLTVDGHYRFGLQLSMFPTTSQAFTSEGETYQMDLRRVHSVLMNPPFTKMERGIQRFMDLSRFQDVCGREIGLWGHFMALSDELLQDNGSYGGVIPISLLRGRESAKIRSFVFEQWTPLYILKPTFNYGFSEWSEYRDILFIARKGKPPAHHRVKFGLVKADLTQIQQEGIHHIVNRMVALDHERSGDLDIETFSLDELQQRLVNLMWFCGVTDFRHRDTLVAFVEKCSRGLRRFPLALIHSGYRPAQGVSSFLFLTRNLQASRTEEAFLWFDTETATTVEGQSAAGIHYEIERSNLAPSLRTGVGIRTLNITGKCDYIARRPYRALNTVIQASGFRPPQNFKPDQFWQRTDREINQLRTHLAVVCRINPFSPNSHLTAFVSETPFSPSDVLNIIREPDLDRAKALCILLNSCVFLAQFFLLKEETTGRYIHVRLYDLAEMILYPDDTVILGLVRVFEQFGNEEFPALCDQLDQDFEERYREFWRMQRGNKQLSLFPFAEQPIRPAPMRLAFDKAVCAAIGVDVSEAEIKELYGVIIQEMIVTRGLQRD